MSPSPLRLSALAALVVLLASCAKAPAPAPEPPRPAAVTLVPDAERSPHFKAVDSHLELGGTLYGYMDVDGDALFMARRVQAVTKQIVANAPQLSMFAKQDFTALFTALGLDDVKAIGLSSVREAQGQYRNRAFLYTPQGRHGLLAVFGGNPGPFVGAHLAPADTDFYGEYEFNLKAVYDTVESVVSSVNGPDAAVSFRDKVRKMGAEASFSLLDLIQGLNGRASVILRLDPGKTFQPPGQNPIVLPAFSLLVRMDGIGPALEGVLKGKPADFRLAKDGDLRIYVSTHPLPIEGLQPVLAFQGSTFFLASTEGFLTECLARVHGLDLDPKFAAGLAALGPDGNGLTWVTPRLFDRLREVPSLQGSGTVPPQVRNFFDVYALNFPVITEPMLSVRTNLPDGILVRSHWDRSLKADLAVVSVYNPVTIGLLAAMAVPAFQKVRVNSQAKAVENNLMTLYRATQVYCDAHQVGEVAYSDLVGPGKPVPAIVPVAGEDYSTLTFDRGVPLAIQLPDGRRFAYPRRPPRVAPSSPRTSFGDANLSFDGTTLVPTPPGAAPLSPTDRAITRNLKILYDAAQRYYSEHNTTSATFEDLVGPGKLVPAIVPVQGENYRSLLFKQGYPLRFYLKVGHTLVYPPP